MQRLDWLDSTFEKSAEKPFIYWRGEGFTYDWLRKAVAECVEAFDNEGIPSGACVALDGDYSPRTVALLLALIDRGCISVPLSPASKVQRDEFLEISEAQYEINVDDNDAFAIVKRGGELSHKLLVDLVDRGDPGLVVFSSGSTGKSKAAVHNFSRILDKFRKPRIAFVSIVFLMLDHLGGINTLLYILSNGGTAVVLKTRSPEEVCAAIERHKVELLPTSPTFLNLMLISGAWKEHDLSSLKRITYGTEVMPESLLKRMHELFPEVVMQQTYGLSELGVLRSKSKDSASLWMKVGGEGFETKIQDGTLWIKAQSAMSGYLNAPSPFSEDGWLNTGDAVEVDGEYIRVLGRQSDMINVGGEKVYPAEVESLIRSFDNVSDVTVFGKPHPIMGQVVNARIVPDETPESPKDFIRSIKTQCRKSLQPFKVPVKIELAEAPAYTERFKKKR